LRRLVRQRDVDFHMAQWYSTDGVRNFGSEKAAMFIGRLCTLNTRSP
jgi:hypothetical protein